MYAKDREDLDGMVYWASYPADDSLKNSDLKFTSIYGTLDSGRESIEASTALLPGDSEFILIEGGNHSQFGNYDLQPGDQPATIPWQEQQAQAIQATVDLFMSLSE